MSERQSQGRGTQSKTLGERRKPVGSSPPFGPLCSSHLRQDVDQNVAPLAGSGDERSGSSLRLPMPTRGMKVWQREQLFGRAACCPHSLTLKSGTHQGCPHLTSSRQLPRVLYPGRNAPGPLRGHLWVCDLAGSRPCGQHSCAL